MSRAYTGAILHHCPNVKLVIDRFHIVKALNEAVDEVRKEEWRELDVDGRKAIKGLRWLLGMNQKNARRAIPAFSTRSQNQTAASTGHGCSRMSSITSGITVTLAQQKCS